MEITDKLSDADQLARRDWFRRHWQTNVPFNDTCRITVQHWAEDHVELRVGYSKELSGHPGLFHGGVLATLIDTTGVAAVLAGHDFNNGSRSSTAAMSVQYLSVAKDEDVVATGRAVKRGRTVQVASVEVRGATSGKLLATGQVTCTIGGERPGLLGPLPGDDSRTVPRPGATT